MLAEDKHKGFIYDPDILPREPINAPNEKWIPNDIIDRVKKLLDTYNIDLEVNDPLFPKLCITLHNFN